MDLTEDEVQKILRLVEELDYGEIHLEIGALRIDLVKTPSGEGSRTPAAPAAASQPVSRTQPPSPHAASEEAPALPANAHVVVAPVAGTFYRAPSPGAKPFVEAGTQVEPDDPVGLLEVMKLFNSVPAGVGGRVLRVLVADATAVAEGQGLVAIEPDSAA
jgi:acetyl-CoA carboxylase biotin carboxyl carrier protein